MTTDTDTLREALEPFAKMGRMLDGPFAPALFKDDQPIGIGGAWRENGETRTITFGDLRRAAAALATLSKPEPAAVGGFEVDDLILMLDKAGDWGAFGTRGETDNSYRVDGWINMTRLHAWLTDVTSRTGSSEPAAVGELVHEPAGMPNIEKCSSCLCPTRYWLMPMNKPLCPKCHASPVPSGGADRNTNLRELVAKAKAAYDAMTPGQKKAHDDAQRESFIRGMTTPCEHGVLDFEQCSDCMSKASAPSPSSEAIPAEQVAQMIQDAIATTEQRVRMEFAPSEAISPPDAPTATELDERNEAMACAGCGTTKTVAFIKANSPTAFTCCPERKMIPVRDLWTNACPPDARAVVEACAKVADNFNSPRTANAIRAKADEIIAALQSTGASK